MKILIMCEGSNELQIINMLLEAGRLCFTRDDLLDLRPFQARQLTSSHIKPALDAYHGELEIFRIGDKMSDKLKVPKEYSNIVNIQKFCTLPELEMLLIIAEGLFSEYQKVKSTHGPKKFCKNNIVFNRQRYDNSSSFYEKYFSGRIDLLIEAIKQYYHLHHTHKRDEGYLADLLK